MRYWCLLAFAFLVGCQPLVETRNTDIITAVGYASISEQPGKAWKRNGFVQCGRQSSMPTVN